MSVHVAKAVNLSFCGGKGSCLIDHYVTTADHAFREIARFVQGRTVVSVIVAAAPLSGRNRISAELERAVAAYDAIV